MSGAAVEDRPSDCALVFVEFDSGVFGKDEREVECPPHADSDNASTTAEAIAREDFRM